MRGFTFLIALLTLVTRECSSAVAARGPPAPRTLIRDVAISLPPGEAVLWGATFGVLSSGTVRLTAHNTGPAAAAILLMPLEQWRQWQACSADIGGEGKSVQLQPGMTAELAVSGGCRQRWVLSVAHVEGPGSWPSAGNATLHLSAAGDEGGCSPFQCMAAASPMVPRPEPTRTPYQPAVLLALECQNPGCTEGTASCLLSNLPARRFATWAADALIQMPKVTLASFYGQRGAVATAELKPGEVAVSVPLASALVATSAGHTACPLPKSFVSHAFWAENRGHPPLLLALMLLHQGGAGAGSPLQQYIEQLPRSFPVPLYWAPSELAQLQYPPLAAAVGEQRRQWHQLYADLVVSTPGTNITERDLTWALAAVTSRSFSSPEPGGSSRAFAVRGVVLSALLFLARAKNPATAQLGKWVMTGLMIEMVVRQYVWDKQTALALVPGIDFVNHASSSLAEFGYDKRNERFLLTVGPAGVRAGQQLSIAYGKLGNDALLQSYGFVEAANPHDEYAAPALLERIRAAAHVPHSRLLHARELGLLSALQEAVVTRQGVSDDVVAAVRMLLAPPEQLTPNVTQQSFEQPSTDEEGAHVRKVLQAALGLELASLPTTLAQDESQLHSSDSPPGPRRQLALQFRMEKKRLLQDAMWTLEPRAETAAPGACH